MKTRKMLGAQYKKFHFQEIDWLLYFPAEGNEGKYRSYCVTLVKRKNGILEPEQIVLLGEVLDRPEIDQGYPHTVGYYKNSSGQDSDFKPEYLELRGISCVEDLWFFLNSLNL